MCLLCTGHYLCKLPATQTYEEVIWHMTKVSLKLLLTAPSLNRPMMCNAYINVTDDLIIMADIHNIKYPFKYNQQDATLYNILYCCQCSTRFRRFFRPSSWAQTAHSITHASGSSKQAWHVPDAVCTVLSSWWWAEKLPETCRALTAMKNIV